MKAALNTTKIFAFILFIIVFGCAKEYSFENHIAKGTLKDTSGICFVQIIHGTFYNGITPGSDTTYVEVKVNVTTTGSYSIFTDMQNGFRFSDSGVFKTAGINIIKLKPVGTPVTHMPTSIITTGTYSTDDPPNGMVFKTFSDACINCAGGGLIPISSGATVTFIITSYDPTTKIVKGTFNGTTIDWFNEIAAIKDGEFSAVVQ